MQHANHGWTSGRMPRVRWLSLWSAESGVAAIEFVLILPIMIFFLFGAVEIYQYFRVAAILDRATFSVADGIAMQSKLYENGPCNLSDHLCTYGVLMKDLMQPVDYAQAGRIEIRLYEAEDAGGGKPVWRSAPAWSKTCGGDGGCTNGNDGTLPANMPSPVASDTLLVVQAFQTYTPFVVTSRFWKTLGGAEQLSSTAIYRPRFEDLKNLE